MDTTTKPTTPLHEPAAMAASAREHLLTVLFGLWMTVGLFLDGYFHQNLEGETESFLTPWHGVFYAGFGASVLWLAVLSRRRSGARADWRLGSLPPGYDGARAGILLFGLGGIGDAAWHGAFGVERGVDALLSPTHLALFVGLVLILTAPLRAARVAPESSPGPWLLVGSLTSATALVGFFLNFAWGLGISGLARVAYNPVSEIGETEVIAGVASTLVATVVLVVSAQLLARIRRRPTTAFTVLFGVVSLLVSAAFDEDIEGVVAAVLAGVALDIILRSRRGVEPTVRARASAFGAVVAGMWLVYFGMLAASDAVAWQAEIWLGAVVLNGLAGFGLTALPPRRAPRSIHSPA